MVDDESLKRRARGYEFQAMLVFESFEKSGPVRSSCASGLCSLASIHGDVKLSSMSNLCARPVRLTTGRSSVSIKGIQSEDMSKERRHVCIAFIKLIPDKGQFGGVDIPGNERCLARAGTPAKPEDWASPPALINRIEKPLRATSAVFGRVILTAASCSFTVKLKIRNG